MTIEKAKEELDICRTQQRHLRKRMTALKDFLLGQGIDPGAPAIDLAARNRHIYSRHLDGLSWDALAKEFSLSKGRVVQICSRMEFLEAKAARNAQEE